MSPRKSPRKSPNKWVSANASASLLPTPPNWRSLPKIAMTTRPARKKAATVVSKRSRCTAGAARQRGVKEAPKTKTNWRIFGINLSHAFCHAFSAGERYPPTRDTGLKQPTVTSSRPPTSTSTPSAATTIPATASPLHPTPTGCSTPDYGPSLPKEITC
jgi:hypothetical protein